MTELYRELQPIKSTWPHAEMNHNLISRQVEFTDSEFNKLGNVFNSNERSKFRNIEIKKYSKLTGYIGYLTHLETMSKGRMFYISRSNLKNNNSHSIHVYKTKENFVLYEVNYNYPNGLLSKIYTSNTLYGIIKLCIDLDFIGSMAVAIMREYKLKRI